MREDRAAAGSWSGVAACFFALSLKRLTACRLFTDLIPSRRGGDRSSWNSADSSATKRFGGMYAMKGGLLCHQYV